MIILDLIHNIALLVTLAVACQVIEARWRMRRLTSQFLYGLLFGAVGVVGMMTPVRFLPGIIFDGRSIILSVGGFWGGSVVALISALICGAYRLWLGGAGAAMGVSVIIESATLGAAFCYWRRRAARPLGLRQLWGFGLLVHGVMLCLILLLPGGARQVVWRQLGLAILGIYPVATMFICRLFLDYEKQRHDRMALEESEERFRRIYEKSPVAYQSRNAEGRILDVNPAWLALLGWSRAEVIGRRLNEFIPPAGQAVSDEGFSHFVESGVTHGCEFEMRRKDGGLLTLALDGVFVRDAQGRPSYTHCVLHNVTERKRAEEALRENEQQLSSIYHTVGDVIFHLEVETEGQYRFVSVNPSFCRVTGLSQEQIVGRTATEVIPEPSLTMVLGKYRQAIEAKTIVRWEEVSDYPTGRLTGEVSVVPVFDGKGKCTHLVGSVHDITERKRVEEALRKSEAELRAILDATPFPIALVDVQDNEIDFWSRSALALFGHTAPTAPQWYQIAYPDPDYRNEVIGRWKPSLEKARRSAQAVSTGEYRVTCHDGSVRICELYAAFLADRLIVTFSDITERKKAEEALRAHQEQLRALASELSLAEERERRRIAMALHDHTCQSLALARMRLNELLEFASAAQAETLGGIGSVLNDAIESVRGLTFDLSSPTLYRFGLEAALEELLEDKFGAEQGIQCDFSDDGESKSLTEDVQVLLFQSVREILINILKHAGAHKITLDIRRTDGSIRIAVTDDGVGFDVDEVSSLPARHRGFGLFSIKERLDCIGGVFEIDSRRGVGSRFTLVAPLKREGDDSGRKHDAGQNSARG